jgi:4'-phosphopantetheinyl transferase
MKIALTAADQRRIAPMFTKEGGQASPFSKLLVALPGVHVWRVPLNISPHAVRRCEEVLSDDEGVRAHTFHFARDRRRFVVVHAVLRMLLGAYEESDPRHLVFHVYARGKPALAGGRGDRRLQFSLSHAHELALMAVSHDHDIGIDLEYRRAIPEAGQILEALFSHGDHAAYLAAADIAKPTLFFQLWTRKEAVAKAVGQGLDSSMQAFDVAGTNTIVKTGSCSSQHVGWRLIDLHPEPAYAGALALPATDKEPETMSGINTDDVQKRLQHLSGFEM